MTEIEIQGLKETQAKMEQMVADLQGNELEQGVRDATLLVTRDAKIFAPVDTGRLVTSILPRVKISKLPPGVEGVVGSKVKYAAAQEARPAVVPTQDPPKGGKYLQRAFNKNLDEIKKLIGNVVSRIVRR